MRPNPSPPLRVGLTGGVGSGKSTVATLLARCGADVIDTDAISRRLTAPGGLAIDAIAQVFGHGYLTADGALNRPLMRTRVFANPDARHQLESILHPLIQRQALQQARLAQQAGSRCVVFEVPLLIESATWHHEVDQVLLVDCPVETHIKRVMDRSQRDRPAILAMIAAQASREQRQQAADIILYNDGLSLDELAQQVQSIAVGFGLSSP